MRPLILAFFLLASAPVAALAADGSPPAAKEHPIVRFYPGAQLSDHTESGFDAVEVVTGLKPGAELVTENLEGRVIRYAFDHAPGTSPVQVVRNFQNALGRSGLATIAVLGGDALDALRFHGIPGRGHFGAFRLDRQGKPAMYVNVRAMTDGQVVWSEVLIVELKEMVQEYVAGAGELFDGLQKSGKVAVYGIQFETGKAAVLPGSEPVLSEVLKLMEQQRTLKLRIVGHTDNMGAAAQNERLSGERAAAVKAWLVGRGVAPARLATAGMGASAPVAANDSEAGRARNRRVELVRLP